MITNGSEGMKKTKHPYNGRQKHKMVATLEKFDNFLKKLNVSYHTIDFSNSRVMKTYSYINLYTNINSITDDSQKWVTT